MNLHPDGRACSLGMPSLLRLTAAPSARRALDFRLANMESLLGFWFPRVLDAVFRSPSILLEEQRSMLLRFR